MSTGQKMIFKCDGRGFVSFSDNCARLGIIVRAKQNVTAYNNEAIVWKELDVSNPETLDLIAKLKATGIKDLDCMYSGRGIVKAFDDGNMELSALIPDYNGGFIEGRAICETTDLNMIENELKEELNV